MLARRFKIVLDRGECISELVHLFSGRHTMVCDQFDFDETHDRGHQLGGVGQCEHAQRAHDFLEQAWNLDDTTVVPRRLDERDDVVLGLLDIDCGLAHQRVENLAHLRLRKFEVANRWHFAFVARAKAIDMVVKRSFDI